MSVAVTPSPTAPSMPIIEAIRDRRSVGKVQPTTPPREAIEALLDAATWAPNHRLTQPWRFFVISGDARLSLGQAMAQAQLRRDPPPMEQTAAIREAARLKATRAPVIVAVVIEPAPDPRVPEVEEICAGAAAIQNMLLAAHAQGLAAIWRTGDACTAPEVKQLFDLDERAHILGFVYVGYPAAEMARRDRRPATTLTTWLGWTAHTPQQPVQA